MGIMVYSLLWVMQDFVHQPYEPSIRYDTLTKQNLLFCRVPMNFILGFIIGTYKKVGFGSLRYPETPFSPAYPKTLLSASRFLLDARCLMCLIQGPY